MSTIFDDYYRDNFWGNPKSVSGNGSDLVATEDIRLILPQLFRELGICNVLDLGCGDYNWWKEMDMPDLKYLGEDVVPELVAKNNRLYGNASTEFRVCDISRGGSIRRADLVFCRDVMVHMNNLGVQATLRNIRRSGSHYLLATTFPARREDQPFDITEGQWRPLNLEIMWGLPKPRLLINEGCTIPGYEDKSLGLWKLA